MKKGTKPILIRAKTRIRSWFFFDGPLGHLRKPAVALPR